MELKKEHTEHEENGTRVERTAYYDPDTKTRTEEIKIERQKRSEIDALTMSSTNEPIAKS
jgi:hypothetical protein